MKRLFSLVVISISVCVSYAQMDYQIQVVKAAFRETSVLPPSPDAAALGTYGNVPVSLNTGIPNISIPMMEMKGKFLNLPVSMSYYASGFRPEEIASWVGLSWSLNAGGVISRSAAGAPDLESNYFTSPSPIRDPNSMSQFDRALYYKEIADGFLETQPDMYYYNFMGKSGKFFLRTTGSVFKKEKDMTVIMWDKNLDEFNIADENGNIYLFDKKEVTSTTPTDEIGGLPNAYNFTSSWYLTSVTSADGSEILNFEYYSPTAQQTVYQGATQKQSKTWSINSSSCTPSSGVPEMTPNTTMPTPTRILRKFLKKITLVKNGVNTEYIEFESLENQRQDLWQADFEGERMLDAVKMYKYLNGVAVLVKSFKLFYSYFPTTEAASGGLRLRLDRIQQMSLQSGTPDLPAYQFFYNTGSLPKRYSYSLDHWGYYNGTTQNSLLPSVTSTIDGTSKTYGDNANRSPNFTYASYALINKIVYPTGGYTAFDFEANGNMGGVRIKRVADYSFDGTMASAKTYTYEAGSARGVPSYTKNAIYSSSISGCVGDLCNCPTTSRKSVTVSATSVYGLGFLNGASIMYTRVRESLTDAGGKVAGYTVTTYENGLEFDTDDDIRSNSVKKQEFYANGGLLLKEVTNSYAYQEVSLLNGLSIDPEVNQDNKIRMCEKNVGGYLQAQFYVDLSGQSCLRTATITTRFTHFDFSKRQQWNPLSEQIVKEYHPASGNYTTSVKKFIYGTKHTNPIRIEEATSNNDEVLVTAIQSIGDYSYSGITTDPVGSNLKLANTRNIKTAEVEKYQYRQNPDGTNKRYIGGQLTTYLSNGLPDKVMGLEINSPLTVFTPSSFSSIFNYAAEYKTLGTIKYDASASVIEQGKLNDVITSYIWDYDSKFPVASVVNASQQAISYTSFETSSGGGWTITTPGAHLSSCVMGKRSMTLAAGTIISKTFAVANTQKYVVSYWSQNASLSVKGNGSIIAPVQGSVINGWTYFEHIIPVGLTTIEISGAAITADELRGYPANAEMTTYNYDVATGLISQCSAGNQLTYYEYDGLGRVVNLKDDKGNIVKNYAYNYGVASSITQNKLVFYNTRKQVDLTKNGCPTDAYSTTATYVVEEGKHQGLTQAEADQFADNDILQNGQNYANGTARCYWKNASLSKILYKECEYNAGPPEPLYIVVSAGQFTSYVSQQDADDRAQTHLNSFGQAHANEYGTCLCEDEGERFLGGVKCTKGTRINYSYVWVPSMGKYKCTYYYSFSDGFTSQHYFDYSSTPCYAL